MSRSNLSALSVSRHPAGWGLLLLLLPVLVGGCYRPGRYVWVDDYRAPPSLQDEGYIIRRGDLLNINVWNQRELSADTLVREDGRITLALLNDVDAAGVTPPVLARRLEELFKPMVNNPVVSVRISRPEPLKVAVLGEVKSPGMKELAPESGVLHALAQAGGFTDYAQLDGIFVLRQQQDSPLPVRIRFDYEAISRTRGKGASFLLRTGDVVVVE